MSVRIEENLGKITCSSKDGTIHFKRESVWSLRKIVCVFVLLLLCICGEAIAEKRCGDDVTWSINNEGILILDGNGSTYNYSADTIPWRTNRDDIVGIVIGKGIYTIGAYIIGGLPNLESVTFQGEWYGFEYKAITECPKLNTLEMPNVGSWSSGFISDCENLTVTLTIDNLNLLSALRAGNIKFFCPEVPSDFYIIDTELRAYLGNDKHVVIPDGVTRIYSSVFNNISFLESVQIPDSVTGIERAFDGCTNLKRVTMPETMDHITRGAFIDCESLESFRFPRGIANIEEIVFCDCSSLSIIEIPSTVLSVSYGAFRYCTSLKTVVYCGTNEQRELMNIAGDNEAFINAEWICLGDYEESTLVLPSSSKIIGDEAFCQTAFKLVYIPKSVVEIGDNAFPNNTLLLVERDSIAEEWAIKNGYQYQYVDDISILK